jgi:hypothetical protein
LSVFKWKVSTLILVAALIAVSVFSVQNFTASNVAATPNFIEVSIEGKDKLGVNETGQYLANVSSPVRGELSFSWSVTPQDGKTFLVPDGGKCSLTFVEATEEAYLLSVSVKDLFVGNLGSASLLVVDPYTSPSLYLAGFGGAYNFKVEADGLGWFRVINGVTGSILYSGTSSSNAVGFALGNCTSGGSVYVANGAYSATVQVPNGVRLVIEKGASGVAYSAAVSATCVIMDWQAGFIDYYVSGSRTVYVNYTAGTTTLLGAWSGSWNTTVQAVVDAFSGLAWKSGWNSTVQAIVNAMGLSSSSFAGQLPYDWLVFNNATATYMQNKNSTITYGSTNTSKVVEFAFGNLTVGRTSLETVLLRGNFTQTNSFAVSSHTKLVLDGTVTLAAGSNCNQIVNVHPTTYDSDIEIYGGTWDGNGANQVGTSNGLYFVSATDDATNGVTRIHDVTFANSKTNGVTIKNTASYHNPYFVDSVWCANSLEIGMDLDNVVDCVFSNLILQGNDGNLRVIAGYCTFSNLYLAGSNYYNLHIYGTGLQFDNVFCDYNTVNTFYPIYLDGCKWSNFNNFIVRNIGNSNNNTNTAVKVTKSAWDGSTYSVGNSFSNFKFVKTGTADWKYGFEETDDANVDNNQYSNIAGLAVGTATLYLRGAVSKAQHQNIIGTVTEV